MKAVLNTADSAHQRRSAAQAQARPAPAQAPLIAAMVTLGMSRSSCEVRIAWRSMAMRDSTGAPPSMPGTSPAAIDSRSPPAQKARPLPVMMSTRTRSSSAARCSASRAPSSSSRLMVLSLSGRLRVTVAMAPSTSYRTVSFMALPVRLG
jgi:hypothetical protein